jgi:hypothetical protein
MDAVRSLSGGFVCRRSWQPPEIPDLYRGRLCGLHEHRLALVANHTVLGFSQLKFCASRFAATGNARLESVVRQRFLRMSTHNLMLLH